MMTKFVILFLATIRIQEAISQIIFCYGSANGTMLQPPIHHLQSRECVHNLAKNCTKREPCSTKRCNANGTKIAHSDSEYIDAQSLDPLAWKCTLPCEVCINLARLVKSVLTVTIRQFSNRTQLVWWHVSSYWIKSLAA